MAKGALVAPTSKTSCAGGICQPPARLWAAACHAPMPPLYCYSAASQHERDVNCDAAPTRCVGQNLHHDRRVLTALRLSQWSIHDDCVTATLGSEDGRCACEGIPLRGHRYDLPLRLGPYRRGLEPGRDRHHPLLPRDARPVGRTALARPRPADPVESPCRAGLVHGLGLQGVLSQGVAGDHEPGRHPASQPRRSTQDARHRHDGRLSGPRAFVRLRRGACRQAEPKRLSHLLHCRRRRKRRGPDLGGRPVRRAPQTR